MRFTKFMAAAMAAMTICSCAQQTEEFDTPNDGKTRILFSTQTSGITSYAYGADEKEVESGKVYAFKDGICVGSNELTIVAGKVTASVELSGDIEVGNVIQLRAIANDTVTAVNPTLAEIENRMTVKREGGIPMSATTFVTITAAGGTNVATAVNLSRRVGRILVKAATGTTLPKGLEVSYTKNNDAAYFFKTTVAGTVQSGATKVVPDATTGLVDYLFPSAGAVFTITATSGVTVTTSARKIEPNKSYTLVVTSSAGNGNVEVDFEVGEWTPTTDIGVDMNMYSGDLVLPTSTLWNQENGVIVIKAILPDDKAWSYNGGFTFMANVMTVKGQTFSFVDSVTVQKGKGSLKKRHLEMSKNGVNMRVETLPNIFGVNDTVYVQVNGKSAKGALLEAKATIVHKSLVDADFQDAYKKLSVSLDGREWLNMNSTSTTIETLVAEIKAQSAAIETAGGHEAYIKANPTAFHKTITNSGANYIAPCPSPFVVATKANFEAIGFTSTLALVTENTSTADSKISRIDNATSDYSVFKIASVADATKSLYFTGRGTTTVTTGATAAARYMALNGNNGTTVAMGLDGVITSNSALQALPRLYRCVYIP